MTVIARTPSCPARGLHTHRTSVCSAGSRSFFAAPAERSDTSIRFLPRCAYCCTLLLAAHIPRPSIATFIRRNSPVACIEYGFRNGSAVPGRYCPPHQQRPALANFCSFCFTNRRQGFGGRNNKSGAHPGKGNGPGNSSPTTLSSPSSSLAPSIPSVPQSPSLHQTMSYENISPNDSQQSLQRRPPFFFREEYSNLIVKGNFMTLAAKPILVDDGEWLAHQGNTSAVCRHRFILIDVQLSSNSASWMA